ncbi:MAG: metal ABC transporter permease [Rikenellaceae bacterium]|nr:metal ABC transporter permease [Rikenellaceae bacterium]
MTEIIVDILSYEFLTRALIASILSGITCGIVGCYIVARRMVFLSGGITHASFGGLGMALYAGLDPLLGSLSFAALSSVGIEFAARRGRMREDSAVGIIWALGMAIGVVFMSLRPGYATDLTSYMFGNILLVNDADIEYLTWLTLFVVVGALMMLRKLMFVTFDEDYAKSQGLNTALIAYIMAVVIAVTIVLSIKVMGIILLLSLMTIPAVIANSLTKDYRWMTLWSAIVAVVGNVAGFIVSYIWDIPTGSCIIFTMMAMLISVKILSLCRNRLSL